MQIKTTIVILYSDYNPVSNVTLLELLTLVYITFSLQIILILMKLW